MAQTLPNEEPVSWSTYPAEFILAEKLQTLISRSSANSRAKDVFDLTLLFERCSDRAGLQKALAETFKTRGTPTPNSFVNAISEIDTGLLKSSWVSVKQYGPAESFDSRWERLKGYLVRFDHGS